MDAAKPPRGPFCDLTRKVPRSLFCHSLGLAVIEAVCRHRVIPESSAGFNSPLRDTTPEKLCISTRGHFQLEHGYNSNAIWRSNDKLMLDIVDCVLYCG